MNTPEVFNLTVDQDWTYYDPPENMILKFLGKNYDKDKQRTIYVFRVLGLPFDTQKTEIVWAN